MTALEESKVAELKKSDVFKELPISENRELPSEGAKAKAPASAQVDGVDPSSLDTTAAGTFRWHVGVILISLALPACRFACDGTWTELSRTKFGQGRLNFSLLWSSCSAFHLAWLSQALVIILALALTALLHGRVQSWTVDAWLGLISTFAYMSLPVSYVLACLYCYPILFPTRCLEGYDNVMGLATLFWAVTLTECSKIFGKVASYGIK